MAKAVTFSTGFERSKLRAYWSLLRHYGDNREFARHDFGVFCEARAILERYLGPMSNGVRVLEIGSGQRFPVTLLFHSFGAQAVGIDMDCVAPRPSWRSFRDTRRRNGLERALKTLARQALFDRAYYEALERLADRPLRRGSVDLRAMDACALEFSPNAFDFVVSSSVFEHINDVGRATQEMARVLRPGGVAYVAVCPFAGLSGGHHYEWAQPDDDRRRSVPPWDHLRQNRFPTQVYLNRLREQDYLATFGGSLQIVDVTTFAQGGRHLTEEIARELSAFSREELLQGSLKVVMRKAGAPA